MCTAGTKREKYIQVQQPNQFHCYNQNMRFEDRMDQKVNKYIDEKNGARIPPPPPPPPITFSREVANFILMKCSQDTGRRNPVYVAKLPKV